MDEPAIEAKGLTPIEPELARIDAIRNVAGLRSEIGRLQSQGVGVVFAFGSEEDRKDSSRVIAAALQGGLGLPDRDYYLKKDAKSVELRKKYTAHVAKMLELAGTPAKKAAADAKAILLLETKLAEASQSNIDIRDPDKTHHPMTLDAFSRTAPNLEWSSFFREQGIPRRSHQRLAADSSALPTGYSSHAARDLEDLPSWARPNAFASALPNRFVDENFAFNGTTGGRP